MLKLFFLSLIPCVVFYASPVIGQTCPQPQFLASQIRVNVPNDNSLPASNLYIWADRDGGLGVPFGNGVPGNYSFTSPQVVGTAASTPSVGQIYVVDNLYDPASSMFRKKVLLIANRYRNLPNQDRVAVGRFGSDTPNMNFVLTFEIVYNSDGYLDGFTDVTCSASSTVKNFNTTYLNVGVVRPEISVLYPGSLFSEDFHNSLYSRPRILAPVDINIDMVE